jgi:hypothetical protein
MSVFSIRSPSNEFMRLFDIADWIVRGVLPENAYLLEQWQVRDSYPDYPSHDTFWLTDSDIARLLPDVPHNNYLEMRELCGNSTPEDLLERRSKYTLAWERNHFPDSEEVRNLFDRQRAEFEAEYAAAKQLKTYNAPIALAIERAKLDVLRALMDGRLIGSGLRGFGPDEDENYSFGEFETIRPEQWSFSGVDFSISALAIEGGTFLDVTASMADCIRVFPNTNVAPEKISGWLHGGVFFAEGATIEAANSAPPRKLGRKPMGDGLVAIAVLNAMRRKKNDGTLPSKKEAIIAAAQEWHILHFEKELSRSSAQRILASLLNEMPKLDR